MVKEVKKTGCRNTSGFFFSDCRNLQFLARNVISKANEVTEKKCPETRMKSSFFLKCVWLIQLLPRRCAPQPFRAGSPRWFLYVFMYGVVRQDVPQPPRPSAGEHCSEMRKAALRPLFCCFENSLEKVKPHFWGFMHSPKR